MSQPAAQAVECQCSCGERFTIGLEMNCHKGEHQRCSKCRQCPCEAGNTTLAKRLHELREALRRREPCGCHGCKRHVDSYCATCLRAFCKKHFPVHTDENHPKQSIHEARAACEVHSSDELGAEAKIVVDGELKPVCIFCENATKMTVEEARVKAAAELLAEIEHMMKRLTIIQELLVVCRKDAKELDENEIRAIQDLIAAKEHARMRIDEMLRDLGAVYVAARQERRDWLLAVASDRIRIAMQLNALREELRDFQCHQPEHVIIDEATTARLAEIQIQIDELSARHAALPPAAELASEFRFELKPLARTAMRPDCAVVDIVLEKQ